MAINTLVTIKDAIQAFVDGHDQLKRVIFEADDQRANYITEGNEFPVMFVAPIDVDVTRAMNVHTLRVYVYERINDDRLDVWENANDTSLILRDLRVWWNGYNEDSDIEIVEDPTGTFSSDRELDKLVGYYSDIDFQIPSHGRCEVPVNVTPSPPTTCPVANYIVEYTDGTPIESGTIPSGGTKTVTVPNCPTCDDATWTLTDTNGNTLDTGTIASGGSATIVAPDATININGALWDTVPSGGVENISVRRENTAVEVGSKQGQYFRIADSTVQNSDASYSQDLAAEDSLTLPDSQINVNTVNEGSVVSVKTIDVNLSDSSGTVTPDSVTVTGNDVNITLPDAPPAGSDQRTFVTGQTTVLFTGDDGTTQYGRGAGFLTLSSNNPFSNTNRFTDLLGGSSYSDGVALDWAYSDEINQTVIGWQIGDNGSNISADGAITYCTGLSLASYNDWQCPNDELLNTLKNTQASRALNYAPFNDSLNNIFWSSTTPSVLTSWRMRLPNQFFGVAPATTATTTSNHRAKAYRIFTYAELGL